jgi:putative transposase
MVEKENKQISIRRQCELLDINRSRLYYHPQPLDSKTLQIMDMIDREFTDHPFTGVDRMVEFLYRQYGLIVNHKRIRRLMRRMGLMAIYPRPRTSLPAPAYIRYPCLLKTISIDAPDTVWCSDITYVRL